MELFGHHFDKKKKRKNYNGLDEDSQMETEESLKCRYCMKIDKEKNLMSPCSCKGALKWVHKKCLEDWQKSILHNQSTHPKYQNEQAEVCNICMTEFNIKPPDRHNLMLEYAGNEIANLLVPGVHIVSEGSHSAKNEKFIRERLKGNAHMVRGMSHWIFAIYLITEVISYDGRDDSILGVCLNQPLTEIPDTIPGDFYTLLISQQF